MVRKTRRAFCLGLVPFLAAGLLGVPASADATQAAKAAGELIPPLVVAKSQRAPIYPAAAKASRISGSVVVEMTVDVEGKVQDPAPIEVTHPYFGFEQAAVEAVRQWKFRPALHRGEPVEFTLRFRLHFGRSSGALYGAMTTRTSMRKGPHNQTDRGQPGGKQRPVARGSVGSKKGSIPARRN